MLGCVRFLKDSYYPLFLDNDSFRIKIAITCSRIQLSSIFQAERTKSIRELDSVFPFLKDIHQNIFE